MTCEGSLQSLKQSANFPYSQPDESSPRPPIQCLHGVCTYATSTLVFQDVTFRYPHQNPARAVLLSHACCIFRPTQTLWFEHPNKIRQGVQIMKTFLVQFSPVSCSFLPLRIKISSSAPRSRTPWAHGLSLTWETRSHTHKKQKT
jgi:hypothetical protein